MLNLRLCSWPLLLVLLAGCDRSWPPAPGPVADETRLSNTVILPLRCPEPAAEDLSLELDLSTPAIIARKMPLTVKLLNVTDQPIMLAAPIQFGWTLSLSIESEEGFVPISGVIAGVIPSNPVVLAPGEQWQSSYDLFEISSVAIPALDPGKYLLTVHYQNVLSAYPEETVEEAPQNASWPPEAQACAEFRVGNRT